MSDETVVKAKLRSVTLWFFFVVALIAEGLRLFGEISPETAWVAQGLSICAWVLRFKTTQPIIRLAPPTS